MNRLKIYEKAKEFVKTDLEPLFNQAAEKMLTQQKRVYKDEDDVEAVKAWAEYVGNMLQEEAKILADVMSDYNTDLEEYAEVSEEEELPETPETEVPAEEAPAEPAPAKEAPAEETAPELPADLAAELGEPATPEAGAVPPAEEEEETPAPPEEEEKI